MSVRLAAVVSILLFPLISLAQPLADRVPADAVFYVGWQGADSMPAAYDQSHLKAVLDASNIPLLANDFLPRLFARIQQEEPNSTEALRLLQGIGGPLFRHPSAFYFAGIDWQAGPPRPKLALLCQPGNEADALLQHLSRLATELQRSAPFPVRAFRQGDLVGLAIGFEQETQAIAGAAADSPKPLATTSANFQAALGQVQKEPLFVLYGDLEAIQRLVEQGIRFDNNPRDLEMWLKVRDALGIDGLKRLILTGGFDGADFSTQLFLAAPAPRAGLLTMLDAQPISDDLLRSIPKNASWMGAKRLDLAKLLTEVRTAAGKVDPQAQRFFDMGLSAAQAATMVNLQTGLFEALGDEWAVYNNPENTGRGLLGIALLNRLRKPQDAQRSLSRLELFLDNTINGQLAQQRMQVRFDQLAAGDLKIHYASLPLVSPAWVIRDNTLYAALYPQFLLTEAQPPAQGQSILENPGFVALRKRLGGEKAWVLSYVDLPNTAGNGYQSLLAISQFGLGMADLFNVKTPPLVLPPLSTIRPHLSPAGIAAWTDEAGLHVKCLTPFPGAEILAVPTSAALGLPAVFLGAVRTMH